MMKTKKLLMYFFACALLAFCGIAEASHLMGGQITYTHISGNTYKIRYTLYRDCAGIPAPTSVSVAVSPSIGVSVTLNRITFADVSLLCPGQVSRCSSSTGVPGIEEHIYEGNATFNTPANYTLSVSLNARNAAITTMVSPGSQNMFLSTTLNTLLAPGNSSPNFLNKPIDQFCTGQAASISPNGADANGDVVVYSLVNARQAAATSVNYAAGFNGLNPLTSSTGVSINSSTGVVSFTPSALTTQVAVIAVRAEEFRVIGGVSTKIGEVFRDIQVRFLSCSGNSSPVLPVLPNVIVPVGTNFCVNVNATDALSQTISLNATASVIPPATFNILSSGAGFTNAQFCFTPQAVHAGNTYTVSINAQDNFCPTPGTSVTAFNITVPAPCNVSVSGSSTNASCGQSDGTATASLTNGTPPYNYSWTGPGMYSSNSQPTITGLAPGTYHVNIVDAYQCAEEADIVVGGGTGVQLAAVVTNTTCGSTNGSIDATASIGTPPYSFSLDNGPAQASGLFSNLAVGTYSVSVTDAYNCSGSASFTVNPDADNTPPTAVCQDAVLYLDGFGNGVLAASMVDNGSSDNCGITSTTLSAYAFDCSHVGNNTVTMTLSDAAGNTSTCLSNVLVIDNIAPYHVDCDPVTLVLNASGSASLGAGEVADISHIASHEACGIATSLLSQTTFDCSHLGLNSVTLTVTDVNGNAASCISAVTVIDNTQPSISCPADINVAVNAGNCSAVVNYTVNGSDNCSFTVTQTGGIASGAAFPLGTTTNSFVVTDASGQSAACSFDVTVTTNLAVNAGTDERTYYGYSLDQTVNRTIAATGGGGSYSYNWSLSRPLMCNVVNSVGDEVFSGGSCINNLCPSSGSPAFAPSCTNSSGAVTAKLIEDADVCVTVTDAYGCIASDCFNINSVDARCFAGNSNNVKIKVCHATGSVTNPWVQICIAEPAVPSHLAANSLDCIGPCPCGARVSNATSNSDFGMSVYPNPGTDQVNVEFEAAVAGDYELSIFNVTGGVVLNNTGTSFEGGNRISLPLSEVAEGVYFLRLRMGDAVSSVRLVVTR
ncbi:MAG: HYR domain-containing protein [Bacteroidia bacterium]|nr:HYR domain-containing protein [Bacteroidia bacterium]